MNPETQGANPILEDAAQAQPATENNSAQQPSKFDVAMKTLAFMMGEDQKANAAFLDSKPGKIPSGVFATIVDEMMAEQKKKTEEKVKAGIGKVVEARMKMREAEKAFEKAKKEGEEAILKEINNLMGLVSDLETKKREMLEAMGA